MSCECCVLTMQRRLADTPLPYMTAGLNLKKITTMEINIGLRVKEVLRQQGKTVCWLAEQIPCERSNVYNIFHRRDIGVDLLSTLSTILDHDFFSELSDEWRKKHG